MLIKTTQAIIQVYRQVYNNIIKKDEEIQERCKQMIEADKVIKTNFIHSKQEYNDEIKERFKRQIRSIERVNNGKFEYRKIL